MTPLFGYSTLSPHHRKAHPHHLEREGGGGVGRLSPPRITLKRKNQKVSIDAMFIPASYYYIVFIYLNLHQDLHHHNPRLESVWIKLRVILAVPFAFSSGEVKYWPLPRLVH